MYRSILIFQNRFNYLKKYLLNELLYNIGQYLFLIGIILSLNIDDIKPIIFWALINFTCYKLCLHAYFSIRTHIIPNEMNTKTSLLYTIYNYVNIIIFENIIFLIPICLYYGVMISYNDIFYLIIILLPLIYILSILIYCMSLLWTKIIIILSIFSMYLLFYSGFVIDEQGIFTIFNYNNFTNNLTLDIIILLLSYMISLIFYKFTIRYIKKK